MVNQSIASEEGVEAGADTHHVLRPLLTPAGSGELDDAFWSVGQVIEHMREANDLPLNGRNYITLVQSTVGVAAGPSNSILSGTRPDERRQTMLRVLEVKAAAGEMATEVTDLAMRVCGGAAFRKDVGVEIPKLPRSRARPVSR